MGCVFGKFSDSPPRKPKRHVKRVSSQKSTRNSKRSSKNVGLKRETSSQRPRVVSKDVSASENERKISHDVNAAGGVVVVVRSKEEKEESHVAVEEEKREIEEKKKKKIISRYDFVDGWPKWLVDNIPSDVLATLVPKSADSYEKLAKVVMPTHPIFVWLIYSTCPILMHNDIFAHLI